MLVKNLIKELQQEDQNKKAILGVDHGEGIIYYEISVIASINNTIVIFDREQTVIEE